MACFSVNGVNLYYEVHGSGEPLLLIAGLASDSQSWLPVVEELASYYQVILPDNRGVGRTEPQDVEISIKAIADDCMALLSHLGFSSANIIGHSMGGFVALDCAIRYPQRVSKLILESSSAFCSPRNIALFSDWYSYLQNGMPPDLWFRNIFYWIFSESFFNDIGTLQNAVRSAVEYPYPQTVNAFGNQVKTIRAFNCQEEIDRITSPVLAVLGGEDMLFSPEESKEILMTIPDVSIVIMEGAAHSVHMEKPDEFVRIVRNFLSQPVALKTFYVGHDSRYKEYRVQGKPGWDTSENGYAEFQSETEDVINRGNAPSDGLLLELGCGAGNMTVWFAQRGYIAHGIDIAPTAIEWARERAAASNVPVQFTVGNVVQLSSYGDSFFDFVFDGHCLHCIIGKDRGTLLANVFRVLKPGGYVMFNTMCGSVNSLKLKNYDPESRCTIHGDIASRYYGDPDSILREIRKAGFKIIQHKIEAGSAEESNHYMIIEATKLLFPAKNRNGGSRN